MFEVNAPRLRTLMFERGISSAQLAQRAKINPLTARRVIVDGATANVKTIGNLARFFNVDGNELIAPAKKGAVPA